ncbi:MAG: acyl-ACP thioesterase domain-containing protein [Acidimicrobiia bacterium]
MGDVEFVECPPGGRAVDGTRRVRLGDVTASGRLRLDALAAYLQDIAADDVDEVGIPGAWVLRRVVLRVGELPQFREDVRLVTFCSGTGSRWAERRTTVFVGDRISVEAVALWVYIDETGRPAPLEEWFRQFYAVAANDRKVSGRLQHVPPPAGAERRAWPLRRADFDVLAHVNNAASWQAIEEEIARVAAGSRIVGAEIEYRAPIDPDDQLELVTDVAPGQISCWLTCDREVRVSARVELG